MAYVLEIGIFSSRGSGKYPHYSPPGVKEYYSTYKEALAAQRLEVWCQRSNGYLIEKMNENLYYDEGWRYIRVSKEND